jgi:hypothetical protein
MPQPRRDGSEEELVDAAALGVRALAHLLQGEPLHDHATPGPDGPREERDRGMPAGLPQESTQTTERAEQRRGSDVPNRPEAAPEVVADELST